MPRLSSTAREKLYDAEAAKAKASGRGELPICNICECQIDIGQKWHESHDPLIPKHLGGEVTGIAHARCNLEHNHKHDTPLFAKVKRNRQKHIGAFRTSRPLPGGRDDPLKKKISGEVVAR